MNIGIYLGVMMGWLLYHSKNFKASRWKNQFCNVLRGRKKFVALLLVVNTISFVVSFVPAETDMYVEKAAYGEAPTEILLLLCRDNESDELILEVSARQFMREELEQRVRDAFAYLEKNMQGENVSLAEVRSSLDYALDFEQFPFETSFVSSDYSVIDGDGVVHNDRSHLLSLGYTEEEIQQGIPVNIQVELWYGDDSFRQEYEVKVLEQELSLAETERKRIEERLQKLEQEAVYEEGFYIPTVIEGVQIARGDVTKITGTHVLLLGVFLIILLILREAENKKKQELDRKNCLLRSYSWFVNEMVLLLGAGMQIRNILTLMVRENEGTCVDYRKPLLAEVRQAVHSLELGMTEEQVYYRLGRNIGIPCYTKMLTLLEQNAKHGGKGLVAAFEQEEIVALEQRKNLAKRYGEEAGTKLLGPMVLLLLVIMLMIMVPAFWSFA